ncbi:hypothetical protein C8R44DRAFT_979201 [Mycena epipterygia]|nr:hypothetical protein C8R44DRAFT_979201 [Mycena epipterygia]
MTFHFAPLFSLGLFPLIHASHNVTIEVPDGTTSHGDPHMLCTPASSLDILIFFLTNYIAHAVTVKPYPGESSTGRNLSFLTALLFPTLGLVRGLNAWARHSVFTKGTLERAARSGALCMVVRNDSWEPEDGAQMGEIRVVARRLLDGEAIVNLPAAYRPGERIRRAAMWVQRGVEWPYGRLQRWVEDHSESVSNLPGISAIISVSVSTIPRQFYEKTLDSNECSLLTGDIHTVLTTYVPGYSTESSPFWLFPDTFGFYINSRTVHGAYRLPRGYSLAHVPRDAKVQNLVADLNMELCSSYSIPKAAAGVVQAIYSSFTLFSARGAQIHQYGYAAFGLTVLPYTVMTLVNLVGNLLTPDYSTLYLVESDVLLEAQKRSGAVFEGIVGKLVPEDSDAQRRVGPTGWRRSLGQKVGQMFGYDVDRCDCGPRHSGFFKVIRDDSGETGTSQVQWSHTGSEAINYPATAETLHSPKIVLPDQLLRNSPTQSLPDHHVCIQIPACPAFARYHNPPLFRFKFDSLLPSTSVDEISTEMGIYFVLTAAIIINLVVVGILAFLSDGFSAGDSTKSQRGWTMSWFAFGSVAGVSLALISVLRSSTQPSDQLLIDMIQRTTHKLLSADRISLVAGLFVYAFPAIGGFVVVGQMIREYGTCTRF